MGPPGRRAGEGRVAPEPDTSAFLPGVALGRVVGNYELVDRIGRGGMGEVWRAVHRSLGHHVALKLIRPGALGGDAAQDQVVLRRFEREARTAAGLRSPHATRIQDFGTTPDGLFYQVMELLDGVDLQTLVERFGPQPPARVAVLLRQVCDVLAEAHAQGFVHRDVKPANLFLSRGGTGVDFVKVLDFGLARPTTSGGGDSLLTQAGTVPGSPAYLPPELLRGEEPTDRADIYALGCVAFWLLSGQLVFEARSPIELIVAHLERPPDSVRTRRADVPEALADVVAACLIKDPAGRPSARELSRRLAGLAGVARWDEDDASAWWEEHGESAHTVTEAAPMPETGPGLPPAMLARMREDASTRLRRHFEESRLDLGDFERRIARVQTADSPALVEEALAGLPVSAPAPTQLVPAVAAPGVAMDTVSVPAGRPVLAIMSSVERHGSWEVVGARSAVAVMGSIELDLRDAALPAGVTELKCVAVMGTVTVVVPADLFVDTTGIGVLGSFESRGLRAARPTPGQPSLRISGAAVMGSVEVVVRGPPGEGLARFVEAGIDMVERIHQRREKRQTRRAQRSDGNS